MQLAYLRKGLWSVACVAMLAISQFAAAQPGATTKKVDLFLKDADLYQATQALTRQTGIQFIIAPTSSSFGKINLSLTAATPEEAIQGICIAAGAWAERNENGVYVIRQGMKPEVRVEPMPIMPAIKKPTIIKKIHLMRADPELVYKTLVYGVTFDPVEGLRQLNRFSDTARGNLGKLNGSNLTVVGQNGVPTTVYPMGNGATQRQNTDLSQPPTGDGGNNVILPGEDGARQVDGGGGGFGRGGGGGLGGGGQPPGGGGAGQQNGQLTSGQGLVPTGIDFISYDPTDNTIVVQGDDEAVRKLQQAIALFDVAPQQVEIKVEFITTSSSISKSLGIDWTYARGAVFAGTRPGSFAVAGDPIFLNYSTGNIASRLRARLSTGIGKTVNAPLVRTLNNQIAVVQQVVETTIFINQVVNGPGGITTVPQPIQFSVNTQLIVRPRINADNTVTMNLTPQIQDFGQLRRGPDGQEIPDRLSQLINVVARVKSGETIALAGLTRKSDQSSQSRFPILADLPIIGQFFRTNTTERNNAELLIFVTPRIIEDEETNGGP